MSVSSQSVISFKYSRLLGLISRANWTQSAEQHPPRASALSLPSSPSCSLPPRCSSDSIAASHDIRRNHSQLPAAPLMPIDTAPLVVALPDSTSHLSLTHSHLYIDAPNPHNCNTQCIFLCDRLRGSPVHQEGRWPSTHSESASQQARTFAFPLSPPQSSSSEGSIAIFRKMPPTSAD